MGQKKSLVHGNLGFVDEWEEDVRALPFSTQQILRLRARSAARGCEQSRWLHHGFLFQNAQRKVRLHVRILKRQFGGACVSSTA